jgi:hypothetical protein
MILQINRIFCLLCTLLSYHTTDLYGAGSSPQRTSLSPDAMIERTSTFVRAARVVFYLFLFLFFLPCQIGLAYIRLVYINYFDSLSSIQYYFHPLPAQAFSFDDRNPQNNKHGASHDWMDEWCYKGTKRNTSSWLRWIGRPYRSAIATGLFFSMWHGNTEKNG